MGWINTQIAQIPIMAGGISWLLRDDFTDTRAAGSVDGTPATPGPGTRTVTDDENKISIAAGKAEFAAQVTPVWGNEEMVYDAITRTAGLPVIFKVYFDTIAQDAEAAIGVWQVSSGLSPGTAGDIEHILWFYRNVGIYFRSVGNESPVADYAQQTDYHLVIVLKTAGAYLFIKGGAFTNWELLWINSTESNATLYPAYTGYNRAWDSDFIRIPDETWLPTPLAYDTFTDGDGTSLDAHASDTSGPDGQAVTGRSWTEQSGDWDIQSNQANTNTASTMHLASIESDKADVFMYADIYMEYSVAGIVSGIVARITNTNNYWKIGLDAALNKIRIDEINGGVLTNRAITATTVDVGFTYDLSVVCYGTTIDGYKSFHGAAKVTYGSASLNETETAHGLAGYEDGSSNGTQIDNFSIFPRGTGSEYSDLDTYIA